MVRIELDKIREIRYDWNALASYDDVAKESLIATAATGEVSFSIILNMLWAGLMHEDDQLTPRKVGILLSDHWSKKGKTAGDLLNLIRQAMAESGLFEKYEDNKTGENQKKTSKKKVATE